MEIDPRLQEQHAVALRGIPNLQTIFQIAFCHLCKKRGLVYVCFKFTNKPTQCTKKFCSNCLRRHYGEEDMVTKFQSGLDTWSCPFLTNACCCSKCRCNVNNYKIGLKLNDQHQPIIKQTRQHVTKIKPSPEVISVKQIQAAYPLINLDEYACSSSEDENNQEITLRSFYTDKRIKRQIMRVQDTHRVLYRDPNLAQLFKEAALNSKEVKQEEEESNSEQSEGQQYRKRKERESEEELFEVDDQFNIIISRHVLQM